MSKELYPIGFDSAPDGLLRPKVVSQYLLEKMARAGVQEAFLILRPGKWDIPAYFGDGSAVGIHLAYLTVHVPFGVPFTLNQAYPFVRDATIALGFPDILFCPENAYDILLQHLRDSLADVVLGLFPTDEPSQVGVVEFEEGGIVLGIYEKSVLTHLPFMWAIAVWTPRFTEFLHEFIEDELWVLPADQTESQHSNLPVNAERPIGDVIHSAIQSGLRVEAEVFQGGRYIDIGTPENLVRAIRQQLQVL